MIFDPLTVLPTVGPKRYELLKNALGISRIHDLLYMKPLRYVDQSLCKGISDCSENEQVTISGTVSRIQISGRDRKILDVTVTDQTASIHILFFGGIRFYRNSFTEGKTVTLSGKVTRRKNLQMVHPDIESDDDINIHTGRIVPVYSVPMELRNQSISTRYLRKLVFHALQYCRPLKDTDIFSIYYTKHRFPDLDTAINALHFPESMEQTTSARQRLAYDELLTMQITIQQQKNKRRSRHIEKTARPDMNQFTKTLPFTLTEDQLSSCRDILDDMTGEYPMNRLLQGDVGSGKTVVAAYAIFNAVQSGGQASLMAPTEILARQHYETIKTLLPSIETALLTGKTSPSQREELYKNVKNGGISCLIGTHALIQSALQFQNLTLAVIDEQHRFGLEQRIQLRKKNETVHLLNMSATPIPRTAALTLFGDMDISTIRTKPAGRIPTKTLVMDESRKGGVYNSMEKYINQGRQCYYVVPMIEDNDESELESAESAYTEIQKRFPQNRCALIHGRLKQDEKNRIMNSFSSGEISLLVSTTVIEVGIDVPNATVIVIRHPERFGLAQLHQLRGRVGRGGDQSFCVLLHDKNIGDTARQRLEILKESDDGFEIAQRDLELRGAGEIIGHHQSGFNSELLFADIYSDLDLMEMARDDGEEFIKNNDSETVESITARYGNTSILS